MEYIPATALALTFVGAVWGHALWLSNRFHSIYKAIDLKFDKLLESITDKLEYHERHDDQRFGHISDSIWEMRLQQAIQNGAILAKEKQINANERAGRETISSGSESRTIYRTSPSTSSIGQHPQEHH
jgi:hypothetical protein